MGTVCPDIGRLLISHILMVPFLILRGTELTKGIVELLVVFLIVRGRK